MKTSNSNAIIIDNQQNRKSVNEMHESLFIKVINECISLSQINTGCEISLTLVDDEKIQKMNSQFRNIDAPTDVLSFPMLDMHNGVISSTEGDYNLDDELLLLGDIVISLQKAEKQAEEYGHSYERELAFLTAHGVFHLLGYDHQNDLEESVMMEKQEEVLRNLGLARK